MLKMRIRVCCFLLAMLLLAVSPGAEARKTKASTTRTSSVVKSEKKSAQKDVETARRDLEANKKRTSRELNRLESIRADIDRNHASIDRYQQSVDSLNRQMATVNTSVSELEAELAELRQGYARELRRVQPSLRPMGRLAFIFGGKSIGEIYRRMRYAGEFNRWRHERVQHIEKVAETLRSRRQYLAALDAERRGTLNELHKTRNMLDASEIQTRNIVADLQRDSKTLRETLAERQKRAQNLDNELNRIIADEQRREAEAKKQREAEERKRRAAEAERKRKEAEAKQKAREQKPEPKPAPGTEKKNTPKPEPKATEPKVITPPTTGVVTTGSFEAAKGKMLSPVAGSYSIIKKFGRQQHPDIPNVTIDNPGVDLLTGSGATARAVFAGTVTAIFRQDGYNTIVMIRHGDYLTVYGGLDGISVKRGDSVKAGQTLGKVVADGTGRNVLHFEVRRERTKLNPLAWIK